MKTDSELVKLRGSKTDVSSLQSQRIDGIFVKHDWIIRDIERVLWLPFEYRAECSSVQDSKLVLGHVSGQVTLLAFDFPKLNQ